MDNNWNNLDNMSYNTTKQWALIENVSNLTGYIYIKTDIGEFVACPEEYTIREFDTETELAEAVNALEGQNFYENPENRIPAETQEEEEARQAAWDVQQELQ